MVTLASFQLSQFCIVRCRTSREFFFFFFTVYLSQGNDGQRVFEGPRY